MPIDPGTAMLISGLLSAGAGMLQGNKGEQKSTYTKGQRKQIDEILEDLRGLKGGAQDITQNPQYQQGQEWLSALFNDPEFFKSFEAPLQRQFQEQTVPELANRFASMGSGGSMGSTAFRNQLAREGSNLSTNIAALRGQMQQQGVNQGLQYAQQPFSNYMQLLQQALGIAPMNQYQPPNAGVGALAAPFISGAAQYYTGQQGQQGNQPVQYERLQRFPGQSPTTV